MRGSIEGSGERLRVGGREGVVLGSMTALFLSHGVALLDVQGACGGHSESQDTAEKLGKGSGGARSDWWRRCMCGEHTGGRYIERLSRARVCPLRHSLQLPHALRYENALSPSSVGHGIDGCERERRSWK